MGSTKNFPKLKSHSIRHKWWLYYVKVMSFSVHTTYPMLVVCYLLKKFFFQRRWEEYSFDETTLTTQQSVFDFSLKVLNRKLDIQKTQRRILVKIISTLFLSKTSKDVIGTCVWRVDVPSDFTLVVKTRNHICRYGGGKRKERDTNGPW